MRKDGRTLGTICETVRIVFKTDEISRTLEKNGQRYENVRQSITNIYECLTKFRERIRKIRERIRKTGKECVIQ